MECMLEDLGGERIGHGSLSAICYQEFCCFRDIDQWFFSLLGVCEISFARVWGSVMMGLGMAILECVSLGLEEL